MKIRSGSNDKNAEKISETDGALNCHVHNAKITDKKSKASHGSAGHHYSPNRYSVQSGQTTDEDQEKENGYHAEKGS